MNLNKTPLQFGQEAPELPMAAQSLTPLLKGVDSRRLGRFQLRLLTLQDAPAVLALRDEVLSQLDDADLYVRESDELGFITSHLGGHQASQGEAIGVFDGDHFVAYAMVGFPDANAPDNLGHLLGLDDAGCAATAHVASCMVRALYRGHGLQRVLLAARFSLAQARGRSLCACMVSLHNHASRRNLLREGLRIAWVGELDGLRRQVLALHLTEPWTFMHQQVELVECLDYRRQCTLSSQGWWGVSMLEGQDADALVFARRGAHHPGPR